MSNVISFPGSRRVRSVQRVNANAQSPLPEDALHSSVISTEEDDAFLELIREWPCFADLDTNMNLHQLFELYYDDKLTLSQDCALEFMFHMHDSDSSFDIGNALYTWDEEDRNFFMISISMHAELIDKIKKEEL